MVKVLHIVESFDGQAIEKWLSLLVSESAKSGTKVDWTFYCVEKNAGRFSEQVTKFGCAVICSPYPISMPVKFMKALRATISTGGYDIIHSHHDIMSAIYFLASVGLPIQKRIMHIHNTSLSLPTQSRIKQFIAGLAFRFLCHQMASHIVGVSESALSSFLNGKRKNEISSVIHCAVNIDPLGFDTNQRQVLKADLGIPASALTLLFVGRMCEYKNPAFVVELLEILRQESLDVYAVFVGEGVLTEQIVEIARKKGMGERTKCVGWRNDVREIMAASDVLIFPSIESPMEGLGLAVIEAQSVGLPVTMSLSVPVEAIIIPELVERLSLNAGGKTWSDKIINLIHKQASSVQNDHEKIIRESSFSPHQSLSGLLKLYQDVSSRY